MAPHSAGDPPGAGARADGHDLAARDLDVPDAWWTSLLGPLATSLPALATPSAGSRDEVLRRWSDGPGALTGRRDRPALLPPVGMPERVDALGRALSAIGRGGVDAIDELARRRSTHGLQRNGQESCGGATRLLRAADGWIALSLARDDDRALLGALFEGNIPSDGGDAAVAARVQASSAAALVERGRLLGLPLSRLGEVPAPGPDDPAVVARRLGPGRPRTGRIRVVDLTSLWAGPLCGQALVRVGAQVTKVESTERPDGARSGPPAFFDGLDEGKEHRAIAFRTDEGRAELLSLLRVADVVLEASRPRALEQLGIDREAMVRHHGVQAWVSITGYGLAPGARDRVAFGDDAAVAGGLVAWDSGEPHFLADAVADPLTGMTAALAAVLALRTGGGWLCDVPLARVAAAFAGGVR